MRVAHPRLLLAGAVAALLAKTAHGSQNEAPKEAGNAAPSAVFLSGVSTEKLAAMLEKQRSTMDEDTYNNMQTVLNEVKTSDMEQFMKMLGEGGQGVDSIMNHPLMQKKVKVAEEISGLLEDLVQSSNFTDDQVDELGRILSANSARLVRGEITLEAFLSQIKDAKAAVEEDEEMAQGAGDSAENSSI
ncbi:hypothetical protein TGGT1_205210 [Toxoplasma gondii GT1]|uniref:Uncharacterized protein n=3 Tax=Toxoplasma gondii TaxID=5811 RepID=S7UUH1_TOXGG|nr:hypothetical protein TGGT1_205210 [Toxoplasma gondii GT1]KAF4642704.1 hypothetical protein TGRH88_034300 [Toxoplasma gondii]KFG36764.1 hypothetical protein TGFOU_205210 [Toxoplasma gondii FOU]